MRDRRLLFGLALLVALFLSLAGVVPLRSMTSTFVVPTVRVSGVSVAVDDGYVVVAGDAVRVLDARTGVLLHTVAGKGTVPRRSGPVLVA